MNRRTLLQSAAAGLLPLGAGCLGSNLPGEEEPEPETPFTFDLERSLTPNPTIETVVDVVALHDDDGVHGPKYDALIRDSRGDSPRLEDVDPREQRLALLTIVRKQYYGEEGERGMSSPRPVVNYGGELFLFEQPIGGGGNGTQPTDWIVPLELTATIGEGELTLVATNESDETYYVRHYGPPYFGVLLAWDGEPHLMGHPGYEENENVLTENGAVRIKYKIPMEERRLRELAPGEAITDTYVVPEGISEEARIYFDVPFLPEPEGRRRRSIWNVFIGP